MERQSNKFMEKMPETLKEEYREGTLNLREKLISLEKEGKFVFHGSSEIINILEPRQPYIFNKKTKKREKHGELCVVATPYADIAIFRAIVNKKNFPESGYASSFKINKNGLPELAATEQILKNVVDKKGFVYVLDKSLFSRFSNMEWRTGKEIKPNEIILVIAKDLPSDIQLIDKDFNRIET